MNTQKGFISLGILLAIILGVVVVVVGGGAYYVMHQKATPQAPAYQDQTNTSPTTQATTKTPATQQNQAVVGPGTKAVATIDQTSLTTTSANPTITGTASNTTGITFFIVPSSVTLPPQYNGPGTINGVWAGGGTFNANGDVISFANGHWTLKVITNNGKAVLQPGTYKIGGYADSYLVTSGTLTVSAASSVSVSGMTQYTDADFGFSFWYPSDLQVQKTGYGSVSLAFNQPPVAFIQMRNDAQQTEGYLTVSIAQTLVDPGEGVASVQINDTPFFKSDYSEYELTRKYINVNANRNRTTVIQLTAFPSACVNSGCTDRKWSTQTEAALLIQLDTIAQTFRFTSQ